MAIFMIALGIGALLYLVQYAWEAWTTGYITAAWWSSQPTMPFGSLRYFATLLVIVVAGIPLALLCIWKGVVFMSGAQRRG